MVDSHDSSSLIVIVTEYLLPQQVLVEPAFGVTDTRTAFVIRIRQITLGIVAHIVAVYVPVMRHKQVRIVGSQIIAVSGAPSLEIIQILVVKLVESIPYVEEVGTQPFTVYQYGRKMTI